MGEKRHVKFRQAIEKRTVQIIFLVFITVFSLLYAIWNTVQMRGKLENTTQHYCEEITAQMRDFFNFGINSKMIELVNVADSLSQAYEYDEETLKDFLARKADILEFDALILLSNQDASTTSVSRDEVELDLPKTEEIFRDEAFFDEQVHVGFLDGQSLYYSAPVHMQESPVYVLVGIRIQSTMQNALTSKVLQNSTLSCIVDNKGSVLLSPTDINTFMELDSIFQNEPNGGISEEIQTMQKNMLAGNPGTVKFTSVDGKKLMLSYHPLYINNWVVLTIVSADLLSRGIFAYLLNILIVISVIASVFMLLLLFVFQINRKSKKQLIKLAYSDSITGGMNNTAFQREYRQAVQEEKPLGNAIVLLNICGFKFINAQLGFEAGDEILRTVHQELKAQLNPECEFIGRSAMDHFFLCLSENSQEQVITRIQTLEDAVNRRFETVYSDNRLTFTAGCCIEENRALDIRALQDRARIAIQNDASVQNICVFYNDSMSDRLKMERELDRRFDLAIANREFRVYLQPKVNLCSNKPEGAEALIRWSHPTLGMLSPGEFIPLFERNGKINRLDFYVFEEVCRFYRKRLEEGNPWYSVSVNLSRYHFNEDNFLDRFYTISQAYELPAGAIQFELTESLLFDPAYNNDIKSKIDQMHELGFLCSIDDFGSGYSSLGILKNFDVDILKIDRSFFMDMDNKKAKDIIRSVVELAEKLHMETVAEGIETPEQIEFLRSIHCDTVQGYVFSKPLPMEEFEHWVSRYETDDSKKGKER